MRLCHVLDVPAWAAAQASGRHAPAGLARDGFLHCCTEEQLAFVLRRHFPGVSGLLVLRFDPAGSGAELRWVRSEPDQAPFPHLHGPLPVACVLDVRPASGGPMSPGTTSA